MSDLIRREDVLRLAECGKLLSGFYGERAKDIIEAIPSAEPKVGKWIEQPPYKPYTDDDMEIFVAPKCSLCGKHGSFNDNYCPNCGAKMKGADDEHNTERD